MRCSKQVYSAISSVLFMPKRIKCISLDAIGEFHPAHMESLAAVSDCNLPVHGECRALIVCDSESRRPLGCALKLNLSTCGAAKHHRME